MASASRFAWEAAKPVTKSAPILRRAGLFTREQGGFVLMCGVILLIGLLLLQKFGVPFGDDAVQICLPITYGAILFLMVVTQKVGVDLKRLMLFGVFATLAVAVNVLPNKNYSSSSLLLVLAIYFPFVFRYYVPQATYKRLMNLYVDAALVIVALVIVQHLIQVSTSYTNWPNLDKIAPEDFLVRNYNYLQVIKYGLNYMKPNAIFLLEASFVSQYIALGLIIELIFFGRIGRLLLLVAGLLLSFGGTGLVLVGACAPFLVFRMSPRVLIIAIILAIATAVAAVETGWYQQVSHRVTEYQSSASSSHARFISPFGALVDFFARPDPLFGGDGAGQVPQTLAVLYWPVTKLTIEYGLVTTVAFFAFFLYSLFGDGGHLRIGFALFIFYNFLSGSLAVPVNALTCLFFCTLFRVANPPPPLAPRRQQRRPQPPPAGRPEPSPAGAAAPAMAPVTDLAEPPSPDTAG